MMIFLRINIFSNFWQERFAYGDCKIFILPMKFTVAHLISVDPVGRFALQQPHYLIDILSGTQRNKAMEMLNPTVQCSNKDILGSGIFAYVFEDLKSDRFGEQRLAIFCRPYEMYPNTYMRHSLQF